MRELRQTKGDQPVEVLDDLGGEYPVTPSELDAIEAFLLPLVEGLLQKENRDARPADPAAPQNLAPV